MRRIYFLVFILTLFSCKKNKLDIDISDIDVKVVIKRFEQIFYTASANDLPKIKKEFRAIFPHDIDSIWIHKMKDEQELELYREVQKVYPNLKNEKQQLENLFKHIKYYYPKFIVPEIITVISSVPLEQKVILDNQKLYISLDVFLGTDNSYYSDYPNYIKQNLTKEHLIVEVARVFANQTQFNSLNRTFIARMIQRGKLQYTIDAFLPNINEAEKRGYKKKQLQWNVINEEMIWRYFIAKKILYSTEAKLDRRFLDEAPFSKFYLDIDTESSGRIGEWLGVQIVKSYMSNNNSNLTELLKMDNEQIFKKSKYKPNKM
ncbi:MAG: gliding motility lipoprotein GldB [Flavobacteriaceae bacterium]|nr:gliding motility lipoprotein GldB [Flavobacteriaceae bacterium]